MKILRSKINHNYSLFIIHFSSFIIHYVFTPLRRLRRHLSLMARLKIAFDTNLFDMLTQRLPLEVAKRHEGLRKQLIVVFPRV